MRCLGRTRSDVMSKLKIHIRQGKRGAWRWHLYELDYDFSLPDDHADHAKLFESHAGMSTIRGYATYDDAVAATKRLFGSAVELVLSSGDPDMDWPQYAGERDWQD